MVVDVEPALVGDWPTEMTQAAAWAVPPTVLNSTTMPTTAKTKQTIGTATEHTIFFTTAPRQQEQAHQDHATSSPDFRNVGRS
jgi:hypothetical protein